MKPMTSKQTTRARRVERLGFRIDEQTKRLIEHAAGLEQRKVTEFCLTALVEAARHAIAEHEALTLSDADRARFFEVLVHPPSSSNRLERAFAAERKRISG